MKRILKILLIIIISQLIACTDAQLNKELIKKSEKVQHDKKIIVVSLDNHLGVLLFENAKLDRFGDVIWTANGDEKSNFPISDDKKCHTSLDTIFYYSSIDAEKNAAVIFRTYQFDKNHKKYGSHYQGSPVGIALFKGTRDKKWELIRFTKRLIDLGYCVGADTEYEGEIEFKKLNSNLNCLYIKQNLAGQQGYVEGYESLYNLDGNNGREVLTLLYHNDYCLTNYDLLKLK